MAIVEYAPVAQTAPFSCKKKALGFKKNPGIIKKEVGAIWIEHLPPIWHGGEQSFERGNDEVSGERAGGRAFETQGRNIPSLPCYPSFMEDITLRRKSRQERFSSFFKDFCDVLVSCGPL